MLTSSHTDSGSHYALFKRLLLLRASAAFVVLLAVLVIYFGLDKEVNYLAILLVVALGGGFSAFSWQRVQRANTVSEATLIKQLLLDVAIVTLLLWFSGRSTNPFIYYFLVIVAISASIFSARVHWAFSVGCVGLYTFLMYVDFNAHLHHMPKDFQLHLLGMWINFVGSAFLLSFFISRLATALRDRQILLAQAREETLKNEQLIGIGTLAASTVHSLGTPLSTLALSLGELKDDLPVAERNQYIALMQAQIERCKSTMSKLSLLANSESELEKHIGLEELSTDIQEYFVLANANPMPEFVLEEGAAALLAPQNYLLRHALINLIENAVQAATTFVTVNYAHKAGMLRITIEDDGEGIPDEALRDWGKPLVSQKEAGLGIGVFLANSTIEKLGGEIQFFRSEGLRGEGEMTTLCIDVPAITRDEP